jgi:uncharacterized protein with FMN-binding domain
MDKRIVIGIIVIALAVALVIGMPQVNKQQDDNLMQQEVVVEKPEEEGSMMHDGESSMIMIAYKDGTYEAIGNYSTPATKEEIGITVTLENDIIVSSEAISMTEHPTSAKMQRFFIEGYKKFVEGKNIDEVELDKVSGSSLTPKGFNDALEKIKMQAGKPKT